MTNGLPDVLLRFFHRRGSYYSSLIQPIQAAALQLQAVVRSHALQKGNNDDILDTLRAKSSVVVRTRVLRVLRRRRYDRCSFSLVPTMTAHAGSSNRLGNPTDQAEFLAHTLKPPATIRPLL